MAGSKAPVIIASLVGGCVLLGVLIAGGVIAYKQFNKKGDDGVPDEIVAGKDQSNNDLVVCLATHGNSLTPGYIKGKTCVIPYENMKAVQAGTWDTFRPESKVGWSVTRPARPIVVGYTNKGETQYLCRGAVGLGAPRSPGFTVDGNVCWVTDLRTTGKVVEAWPQKPGSTHTPFEWAMYM